MKTKICTKCAKKKLLKAFPKDKSKSDGVNPRCSACKKLYDKDRYSRNAEEIKAYQRARGEEKKRYMKDYRKVNKEKLTKQHTARTRKYLDTDPLYRFKNNVRTLVRSHIKQKGFKKNTKTENIIGCTLVELRIHLRATFETNYGIPFNHIDVSLLHIDHIKPMSLAKTQEEAIQLNHYSNLQYLFSWDNIEKRDKYAG